MDFLHVADSATHLGSSWAAMLSALVGVGAGAFFLFGVPALQRRRGPDPAPSPEFAADAERDGVESPGADENT